MVALFLSGIVSLACASCGSPHLSDGLGRLIVKKNLVTTSGTNLQRKDLYPALDTAANAERSWSGAACAARHAESRVHGVRRIQEVIWRADDPYRTGDGNDESPADDNGRGGGWVGANASSIGNPFAWSGQRFDAATGTYHFWARTYSPVLGRLQQSGTWEGSSD